ncbi:hypothetical protein [Lysobacter sp. ESA13C]|uniref:hypothetical protein n=1 Tax=Lysobacter sp. ESA13C TaxID=2862676 RepID=UPI001CBD6A6B|nr:hypothetical protein [Lysobacter sp. ESA13C]
MPFDGFIEYAEIAFLPGKFANYRSVTDVGNKDMENREARWSRSDGLHALRLSFRLQVHAESFRRRQRQFGSVDFGSLDMSKPSRFAA